MTLKIVRKVGEILGVILCLLLMQPLFAAIAALDWWLMQPLVWLVGLL